MAIVPDKSMKKLIIKLMPESIKDELRRQTIKEVGGQIIDHATWFNKHSAVKGLLLYIGSSYKTMAM